MKCSSNHPRAIKTAQELPQRLKEVHQGKIVLQPDAVYHGSDGPLAVSCTVCGHDWEARQNNLIIKGHGCPACKQKSYCTPPEERRAARVSDEIKEKARQMYREGMSQRHRGSPWIWCGSINRWVNPAVADKCRRSNQAWNSRIKRGILNQESWAKTAEGLTAVRSRMALRRKRKRGETEWVDEVNGLVNLLHLPTTGTDRKSNRFTSNVNA